VWSDIIRGGPRGDDEVKVGELGRRSAQDAQIYRLLAPPHGIRVYEGDRILMHCIYTSVGKSTPTYFGADERVAEMCNQYLLLEEGVSLSCQDGDGSVNGECTDEEGKGYEPVLSWPLAKADSSDRAPPFDKVGQVSGVDVDQETGDVYLFHRSGRNFWNTERITDPTIMKLSSQGAVLAEAGAGLFVTPHSITLDKGGRGATPHEPVSVWVTDTYRHQVLQLSGEDGKLIRALGVENTPGKGPKRFNKPTDVAVASEGSLYISDGYGNSRVVIYRRDVVDGVSKYSFESEFGRKGDGDGEFDTPHGVTLDDQGRVYVADRNNGRLQVFEAKGKWLATWDSGIKPLQQKYSNQPWRGYVCAVDYDHTLKVIFALVGDTVTMYDLQGRKVQSWGSAGSGVGQLNFPHAIAAGGKMSGGKRRTSFVYTAELDSQRLQKFGATDGR